MYTVTCPICQGYSGVSKCIRCGGTGLVYSGPGVSQDQLDKLGSKKKSLSDVSVEQFAIELKKNVDLFIDQLKEAGLGNKKATDSLSEEDKMIYLQYLIKKHQNK